MKNVSGTSRALNNSRDSPSRPKILRNNQRPILAIGCKHPVKAGKVNARFGNKGNQPVHGRAATHFRQHATVRARRHIPAAGTTGPVPVGPVTLVDDQGFWWGGRGPGIKKRDLKGPVQSLLGQYSNRRLALVFTQVSRSQYRVGQSRD